MHEARNVWVAEFPELGSGFGVVERVCSRWRPLMIRSKWRTEAAVSNASGAAIHGRITYAATATDATKTATSTAK